MEQVLKIIIMAAGMLYLIVGIEATVYLFMAVWTIRFQWDVQEGIVSFYQTKCLMKKKFIMEWNMVK